MENKENEGQPVSPSPVLPYLFSNDGRLCHRDSKEPYVFRFRRGDPGATQTEEDALNLLITQHVHRLLEETLQLRRLHLPAEPQRGALDQGFVYLSPAALELQDTLLVLIQDWGTVRCGLWSWRAVAHEGLARGSQIPYVQKALEESYSVLLMNPNESGTKDRGESARRHVHRVWDSLLASGGARRVVVVAHGYGGLAFVDLLCQRLQEVQLKVWAVAFLDSSHSMWHQPLGTETRLWLQKCSRRWVLSSKPLNRNVGSIKAGAPQVSAGSQCHDTMPAVCMESVFEFFAKTLQPKPPTNVIVTRSRGLGQGGRTPNA